MQSTRHARHPAQGDKLVETRRSFMSAIILVAAASVWASGSILSSQNPPVVRERKPASDQGPAETPDAPTAGKHMLDENEKEIKKKVERLYDLASELKAEVEKTDSSKVLSLNLIKKTEEIEKLARDIRSRSKG
jgi:hypothetical protein